MEGQPGPGTTERYLSNLVGLSQGGAGRARTVHATNLLGSGKVRYQVDVQN